MAKYHNTPDGPRPCTARVRACPIGGENDHYTSKESAQEAYEKSLEETHGAVSTTTRKSVAKSLKTETPVNIDNKLAELYSESSKTRAKLQASQETLKKSKAYLEKHVSSGGSTDHPNYRTYERVVSSSETEQAELRDRLDALSAEAEPYNAEFERRGGWTRAFLVNNGNGHVHKNMECSTCFPSTEYSWMTDYSGKKEEEIVDAAGERACTVCYPSAPVSSLSKPTKMFTEEEERLARVREERERKRVEKEAKAKAAGITAEDGGPLKVTSWGRSEVVKTERSAQTIAVDAVLDKKRAEVALKNSEPFNQEVGVQASAKLDTLVPALARKRGQEESEVLADLTKKASAKWKREYAAHFGDWTD